MFLKKAGFDILFFTQDSEEVVEEEPVTKKLDLDVVNDSADSDASSSSMYFTFCKY